jgi:hypothetical protein
MQQSEPDVQSLQERIALLERQSNLKRQAFEYLTQLRLTNLTLEYEVEWTSDCEPPDGKSIGELSDASFDASASEYDYDDSEDDSIPAPAEEKPVFLQKQVFWQRRICLPDYDTEARSAPAAGEGAGFSGPEYDPECGSSMIPLAHWAKLAAAISRLRVVLRRAKLAAEISRLRGVLRRAKLAA